MSLSRPLTYPLAGRGGSEVWRSVLMYRLGFPHISHLSCPRGQLGGKPWLMGDTGAVLLTSSVIHSLFHQPWVASFRGLRSGLSAWREAASSRSSVAGRSSHSLVTWPQTRKAFPFQISVSSSLERDDSGSFSRGRFYCF